ncbi:hypothetical protein ACM64Y_01870 [Novispirillum sp. DQ9]|uniref:hypothetical protein n=1 Tax=Novispirillum sp. DQ9 TaxID=3398612 RepID=UPI003C798079
MIAVLHCQRGGVYWDRPGVDAWDEARDARRYAGPWPVVAHPDCARWGRFWYGSPSSSVRHQRGDDDGRFQTALHAVRRWGGVLEHPAHSYAWDFFGLLKPTVQGWSMTIGGDWVCQVDQGRYGHGAPKSTWLLYCGVGLPPPLLWGRSNACGRVERMSRRQREATPPAFADLLISLAAQARPGRAAA